MSPAFLTEDPGRLLVIPRRFVDEVMKEDFDPADFPKRVAQLPRFLRTFYLRFLAEEFELHIEGFTKKERGIVSDLQVDLEVKEERPEAWDLLFDFVDLCDSFEDMGLMSVPEDAGEHESAIFDQTTRVLGDLSSWAVAVGHKELSTAAGELTCKIKRIAIGQRTQAARR